MFPPYTCITDYYSFALNTEAAEIYIPILSSTNIVSYNRHEVTQYTCRMKVVARWAYVQTSAHCCEVWDV